MHVPANVPYVFKVTVSKYWLRSSLTLLAEQLLTSLEIVCLMEFYFIYQESDVTF